MIRLGRLGCKGLDSGSGSWRSGPRSAGVESNVRSVDMAERGTTDPASGGAALVLVS